MKKLFYSLLCLAFAITAMAQIPTSGLLAHYPFNYTLDDTSGNGKHITAAINQSAISYVPGKDGAQALDLANASLCANIQTGGVLNFNNTAITISFWAYFDDNVVTGFNPHALIATANASSNIVSHSIEYQLQSSTSAAYLSCYSYYNTNYTSYSQLEFDIRAYLNEWHLFTYTYDKSDSVSGASLYIDGTLVKSQAVSSSLFVNTGSNRMRMGAAGAYCPTSSIFDDVMLYNRALTSLEVDSVFSNQFSGCQAIVADFSYLRDTVSACELPGITNQLRVPVGTPGVSYQWLKDGVAIPGATASTYDWEFLPSTTGVYSVKLTTTCDTLVGGNITIIIRAKPAVPTITSNGTTLTSTTMATNYQWFLDGVLLTDNTQSITATADGNYRVIALGTCASDTSAPFNYEANRVCSFTTTHTVGAGNCPSVTFEVDGATLPVTAFICYTGQPTPSTFVFDSVGTTLPDFCPSTYLITLSDANGCTDTLTFTLTEVGISEVNNNISINLYPNPTSQTLAINTSEILTGVEVYNVMGQQVVSIAGNATQIDVTTLPAGTYYLNAITNQGTVRKPFVKL